MPVYLAHGFRWSRNGWKGVRVHTILQNLEDVSPDYVQNAHSRAALLASLRKLYPSIMSELEKPPSSRIEFLEQYDPEDVSDAAISQPYVFVCDRVVMIAGGQNAEARASQLVHGGGSIGGSRSGRRRAGSTTSGPTPATSPSTATTATTQPSSEFSSHISALSLSIEDVTSQGSGAISPDAWAALAELRDNIAEGERIGWWVVFNGDPERSFGVTDEEESEEEDDDHIEEEEEEEEEEEKQKEEEEEQKEEGEEDDGNSNGKKTNLESTPSLPKSAPVAPVRLPTQKRKPVPTASLPSSKSPPQLHQRPSLHSPIGGGSRLPYRQGPRSKHTEIEPSKPIAPQFASQQQQQQRQQQPSSTRSPRSEPISTASSASPLRPLPPPPSVAHPPPPPTPPSGSGGAGDAGKGGGGRSRSSSSKGGLKKLFGKKS